MSSTETNSQIRPWMKWVIAIGSLVIILGAIYEFGTGIVTGWKGH